MPAGVSAITALANLTLSSAQTTVTFSSISGAYRDLYLVYRGTADNYYGSAPSMRFNGDSSVAYPCILMTGDASSAIGSTTNVSWIVLSDGSYMGVNQPQTVVAQIMDYSVTDKHKSVLSRANNPNQGVCSVAGRWPNTAAITSITLSIAFASPNFVAGSTFALYGISA
jgi:hypothetical protein